MNDEHVTECVERWRAARNKDEREATAGAVEAAIREAFRASPRYRQGQWLSNGTMTHSRFARVTRITKQGAVYGCNHYRVREPSRETQVRTRKEAQVELDHYRRSA